MSPVRFHDDKNMKHQNKLQLSSPVCLNKIFDEYKLTQLLNFEAVHSKMFKKYQINCNNKYFQCCEEIFDPTINQLEVAKVINIGASLILHLVHTLQEERAN